MQLFVRVHVEFVITGGQIYKTKTLTVKCIKKGNGNEGNINIPKAPDESKENLLSCCRITFEFHNKALRYAQYPFQNKLWNKNDLLEYLRTCCFSKEYGFNTIDFSTGARKSWTRCLEKV